jgi:hypothetical protein
MEILQNFPLKLMNHFGREVSKLSAGRVAWRNQCRGTSENSMNSILPSLQFTSSKPLLALAMATVLLTGCAKTRSISNSSYSESSYRGCGPYVESAFQYRGELNEFDVLAVARDKAVTDGEIKRALEEAKEVKVRPGAAILVVQSGAVFPDGPMFAALKKHFAVTPFSGVPPHHAGENNQGLAYSKSLRLAAARAGCEIILCYWGTLESARRKMETKTISWVPIAGWMIPDESQQMRIRLKLALVDVGTGNWRVICPDPFEGKAWSNSFRRGSSDQRQVEVLKKLAYEASVKELLGASEPQLGLAR